MYVICCCVFICLLSSFCSLARWCVVSHRWMEVVVVVLFVWSATVRYGSFAQQKTPWPSLGFFRFLREHKYRTYCCIYGSMYLENVLYSITVSYHNIILMDIYRTLYGILGVSLFIIFHEMRQSKSQASDKQATSETTLTRKSQVAREKSGITISPEWSVFNRFLLASIRRKIPAHTHIRGAHQMSHTHN